MDFLKTHRKRWSWLLVLISAGLMLLPLVINSCSTSSYDTPITAKTTSVLILPETLKTWVDEGVVNSTGYDRVVILDVNSQATYTTGHIPGAQFLNSSDLYQIRQEGPATDINMVLDGAHMDALVQRYGIDNKTTIVFTSGSATPTITPSAPIINATRAYWTFRYWGFPREKLKVLDGINPAWAAAYGLTTDPAPSVTPSTYSVKNNASLRTDLRASLSDMINVAEGKVSNAIPVDMRSSETDGSYVGRRGSTTGVFTPGSDHMVFEGRVKGGRALLYTDMLDPANNYRFKPKDALAAMFMALGVESTKTAHVY